MYNISHCLFVFRVVDTWNWALSESYKLLVSVGSFFPPLGFKKTLVHKPSRATTSVSNFCFAFNHRHL